MPLITIEQLRIGIKPLSQEPEDKIHSLVGSCDDDTDDDTSTTNKLVALHMS